MASRYQIRPSSSADLAALAALEEASFADPWSHQELATALSWSEAMTFVAETPEGEAVGYLLARLVVDQGEILSLATNPAHRRAGIASLLLDRTLSEMQHRGAASIWLEVRDSNHPAQALYQRRGFVATGRRRGYYRQPVEDALVLCLEFRKPALFGAGLP